VESTEPNDVKVSRLADEFTDGFSRVPHCTFQGTCPHIH